MVFFSFFFSYENEWPTLWTVFCTFYSLPVCWNCSLCWGAGRQCPAGYALSVGKGTVAVWGLNTTSSAPEGVAPSSPCLAFIFSPLSSHLMTSACYRQCSCWAMCRSLPAPPMGLCQGCSQRLCWTVIDSETLKTLLVQYLVRNWLKSRVSFKMPNYPLQCANLDPVLSLSLGQPFVPCAWSCRLIIWWHVPFLLSWTTLISLHSWSCPVPCCATGHSGFL